MAADFTRTLRLGYEGNTVPIPRRSCPQCGGTYPSNAQYRALDGTALFEADDGTMIGRTIDRYKIIHHIET